MTTTTAGIEGHFNSAQFLLQPYTVTFLSMEEVYSAETATVIAPALLNHFHFKQEATTIEMFSPV